MVSRSDWRKEGRQPVVRRHHRANRGRFSATYMHSCMSRENLTVNAHRCSASQNQTGQSTGYGGAKGQRAGRFCMQVHFRFSALRTDSHERQKGKGEKAVGLQGRYVFASDE